MAKKKLRGTVGTTTINTLVSRDEKPKRINPMALAYANTPPAPSQTAWAIPKPMPGVVPAGQNTMAMDDALGAMLDYASNDASPFAGFTYSQRWLGFPVLAELAQIPEYRRIVGVIAQELTRRWCHLRSVGDKDNSDKIERLEAAMTKFNVKDVFREAAEADGFYGIAFLYIDTGAGDNPDELKTPLMAKAAKIGKGGLKRIKIIQPNFVYPAKWNARDPLAADFYRPETWWVYSKEIHRSRLIPMVSRPVPDLLKPVYQFGGVSLTQLAMTTVDNWTRTRKSVSDLLHSFTVWQLKMNMSATLMGEDDGGGLVTRAEMFTKFRDNRGLMVVDKESEELANISVPLGGLDALQAQAQQHMAAVSGIPLTKLLGTPPSGLQANSEGELQSFYDSISAQQEHLFTYPLKQVMDIIQLSEFGEIDDNLRAEWIDLHEQDEAEQAVIRKTDADTDVELIAAGVLAPIEARQRLASTEGNPYHGLVVDDVPEPPENEEDPMLTPDPAKGLEGAKGEED